MIDYINKDLFGVDSINKQWIITVTSTEGEEPTVVAVYGNSDIEDNSISITEKISSSDGLVFGRCETSEFEFTIYYDQTPTIAPYKTFKGCELTVDLILDYDTEHPFRVGNYIVDEDKSTADRHHRRIRAYDRLSTLAEKDVSEWYKELTFPMSIKDFRDSFFEYIDIPQETTTLCNDEIMVNKGLDPEESISATDILQAICEINGAFGHIGRDDIFHYIVLGEMIEGLFPAEDLYPSDDLYPRDENVDVAFYRSQWSKVQYEDYRVKKIDGVIVLDEEGKIAGYTSQDLNNPFKLENNFFTSGIDSETYTTIAENLYSVIGHCWYMVGRVDCPANLCIEVGDTIRVNTREKIVYMYVLYRNVSGLQFLQDSLESSGEEDRSNELNSVSKQLTRLKTRSKYDIEVNTAKINELEADHVSVADLQAQSGRIDNLSSSVVNIDGQLTSVRADITTLYGTDATFSGELTALKAKCTNLTVTGVLKASAISPVGGTTIDSNCININGIVTGMQGKNITIQNITATGGLTVNGYFTWGNVSVSLKSVTVDDAYGTRKTVKYLSWE